MFLLWLSFPIALYVVWRLVWRLPSFPTWAKWVLTLVVLVASQQYAVFRLGAGTMASPELPRALILLTNWGFASLLFITVILLLWDIVGMVLWLVARRAGRAILTAYRSRAAVALLLALGVAYGVAQAVRVPDVKRIEVRIPNLPAALDGYRMVHLTDLHASRILERAWMQGVVDKALALDPNVFVLTGDLADGTVANRRDAMEPLRQLALKHRVVSTPGNHEYYSAYHDWMQHLDAMNLHMLQNEHVLLEHQGAQLAVAAVTDEAADRVKANRPDIAKALQGIPAGVPTILLSHRPKPAVEYAKHPVALQLSGHTHGGHALGMQYVVARENAGFVSGLYQVGNMQLYVSNGAGLWPGFAIRLGVPSEITEITLRPEAQ